MLELEQLFDELQDELQDELDDELHDELQELELLLRVPLASVVIKALLLSALSIK